MCTFNVQGYYLHLKIMTARRNLMSSGRMQCVTCGIIVHLLLSILKLEFKPHQRHSLPYWTLSLACMGSAWVRELRSPRLEFEFHFEANHLGNWHGSSKRPVGELAAKWELCVTQEAEGKSNITTMLLVCDPINPKWSPAGNNGSLEKLRWVNLGNSAGAGQVHIYHLRFGLKASAWS